MAQKMRSYVLLCCILLLFPNILRSLGLGCLVTCEATVMPSLLYYTSTFPLRAVVQNCNQNCLQIFLLLSSIPVMIQVPRKRVHLT